MGFNQVERIRRDAGSGVGALQGDLLSTRTRRVNRAAAAIAGRAHAFEDSVNPVAITLSIGQALQHQHAEAFSEHGAITIRIKRLGIPRRRERRRFAEAHVHENVVEGIDPAGDDHIRQASSQFQPGQVNRGQRAGAGCIDHAIGAAQIEAVGDPPCRDIAEQAGEGVFLPTDVGVGDALHYVFGDVTGHAGIFEGLAPVRVPQTRTEWDHQFECAGDAENDAGAVTVEAAARAGGDTGRGAAAGLAIVFAAADMADVAAGSASGIPRVGQRLLRRDQAQQL